MVTILLIAINVLISFAGFSAFRTGNRPERFLFTPSEVASGRNFAGMVLSQFSHGDAAHLLFNMISLYFFGPVVEEILGAIPLLAIYAGAGILSTAVVYVAHRSNPSYRALGASGSISGVIFASIVLYPDMNIYFALVPLPIPGPIFAIGYLLLSTFLASRQRGLISHEAHVGGAVAGFLLAGVLSPEGYGPLVDRLRAILS